MATGETSGVSTILEYLERAEHVAEHYAAILFRGLPGRQKQEIDRERAMQPLRLGSCLASDNRLELLFEGVKHCLA